MNFGVLVCTHQGHRRFLKMVLENLRKANPRVILVAYDYPFNQNPSLSLENVLPSSDVMKEADSWFFNEIIFKPGKGVGPSWVKQQNCGTKLLESMGVEHVISVNGDCVFTNPDGVKSIFDMLIKSDGDLISCHYTDKGYLGTMCYFAKMEVAVKVSSHVMKYCLIGSNVSPEARFGKAVIDHNFKCVPVENQETAHFSFGKKGTFFNTLGLRHLHGTEKWRIGNHHKPLPRYFYDERYLPLGQLNALKSFWETGKTDKLIELGYWNKVPIDSKAAIRFFDEV